MKRRTVVLAAVICGLATVGAAAQSPAGKWEGIARVSGMSPLSVTLSLDSTASGWQGSLTVPQAPPFVTTSVSRAGDTLVFRFGGDAQNSILRLRPSADGRRMDGVIQSGSSGTVVMARAGSPEAAALIADFTRVERSRRTADSLYKLPTPAAPATGDPNAARLVTSDIALFWNAVDRAPADSLAFYLERDYLEKASVGVRDFIPGRILSAEDLAAYVRGHRATYDSVRAANLDVTKAESAIRAAFIKLKSVYSDAVFPDVYFVVGRFNSGGTASNHGLLIGSEMYRDPTSLPSIVSHELIHFEQHYPNPQLLEHSFLEGSADFIGELISGKQINSDKQRYGLAHEAELWKEFSAHFDDKNYGYWMYNRPPDGRPNDLGYFIGYRIAQAYYEKAADKTQAIRDIVTARNGNVRELLTMSGYAPSSKP